MIDSHTTNVKRSCTGGGTEATIGSSKGSTGAGCRSCVVSIKEDGGADNSTMDKGVGGD
jgi:hypothetical protein